MILFEYKLELFGTFSIAGVEEVTEIPPATARYSHTVRSPFFVTARNEVTWQSHFLPPTLSFFIFVFLFIFLFVFFFLSLNLSLRTCQRQVWQSHTISPTSTSYLTYLHSCLCHCEQASACAAISSTYTRIFYLYTISTFIPTIIV